MIQRLIIRWSLKQLANILRKHPNVSYNALARLGVEDFSYRKDMDEFTIVIK